MTTLGIRYLTGCAVSSDMTRKNPEFPPHPGRVFMALAAAHFQTRGGLDERRALEWIERQNAPPSIRAPHCEHRLDSSGRAPVETYVPVNDKHGGIVRRMRQARSFATVRLEEEEVFLTWDAEAPEEVRSGLDRLCAKVTRIGHSSSLVQMWVAAPTDRPRPANWIPDDLRSSRRMRVAEPGTLSYLEKAFRQGDYPRLASWKGYRTKSEEGGAPPLEGIFDSHLVVLEKDIEGRVLGLEATMQLTSALRNAVMKSVPEGGCPEWLSGHQPNGQPSLKPHVAFLPLPFVGAPYADGHVLGLAMAIPRDVPADEARRVIGAFLFNQDSGEERTIRLWRNPVWEWCLRRETRDQPPLALRSQTWTAACSVWASVTPVVLHHYPKKGHGDDIERILREAFASAGLPAPRAFSFGPGSCFEGAPDARSMPEFAEGGPRLCRYQTHVVAEFEQPVRGPVLVGRGRYRGYGLFRPLKPKPERS